MKVIIWGYKPHSHTHSYIHWSFYLAFQHLGYQTTWFDDLDDVSNFDFSNSLILTSNDQNKNIPLRKDCKYIIHNVDGERFSEFNPLTLQVYSHDVLDREVEKISNNHYYQKNCNLIYQPWATDLLPNQIDINQAKNNLSGYCLWVGTYGGGDSLHQNESEITPFFNECKKSGIDIKIVDPWSNPISFEDNKLLVNNSCLSPSLQGPWQIDKGYIPCRIFKNISYGHFGITNSDSVNQLFDNSLIYDNDPVKLFYKVIEKKNSPQYLDELKNLMNIVKENHTYVNRIKTLLQFI